jgi:hypothetical protein
MSEVLTEQNNSEPATPPITKKRHPLFYGEHAGRDHTADESVAGKNRGTEKTV